MACKKSSLILLVCLFLLLNFKNSTSSSLDYQQMQPFDDTDDSIDFSKRADDLYRWQMANMMKRNNAYKWQMANMMMKRADYIERIQDFEN